MKYDFHPMKFIKLCLWRQLIMEWISYEKEKKIINLNHSGCEVLHVYKLLQDPS